MDFDKYFKLKNSLETFTFEKNFKPLSNTLYYFSFLGNIFLVLLSFFFIKDITSNIPTLFKGQEVIFSTFIILFMTGYELFKRFAFEQFTVTALKVRSITFNLFIGAAVCLALVVGSFYLALNGANRLVDDSLVVESIAETKIKVETDSVFAYYEEQIVLNKTQIKKIYESDQDGVLTTRARTNVLKFENTIKSLDSIKNSAIKQINDKYASKVEKDLQKTDANNLGFVFITFSLEFIILIGVGFSSYYKWNTFVDMKRALTDPKYKKVQTNLALIKLYYQNGRKRENDQVIPVTRFRNLVSNAKLQTTFKEITEFLSLCEELGITAGGKKDKKYAVPYERAKQLIQTQDL